MSSTQNKVAACALLLAALAACADPAPMAIGEYNSHATTLSCTEINAEHVDAVLEAYHLYSAASGWPERAY